MTSNLETTENKEEFQNDKVQFVIKRKPHCVVEYETEVLRSICEEAQKKAARDVGKEAIVPGFRKGKAPVEVVVKRYPQEFDKRWQEAIANSAYKECASLAQVPLIRPDATITFSMHSHSSHGAKLTLSFETVPVIPSIDPAQCVLKAVKSPEVSKEKVDETIRQTQMFFSKWHEVKGRPIQEGDFVVLDVDILEENPPQRLFSNTRFEVTDKSMASWMKALLLGRHAGETVEGVSVADETLSEEEKKEFPPKKVSITIRFIEETELPELNDAFANQLGLDTVDQLYPQIEQLLTKKAREHVREQQREQVTEFLLSHPFDIPNSVIQKETQFRLEQMIKDPQFKQEWETSTNQGKGKIVETVKAQAEKAVRIFYLCRKIAADQKIQISPKDLSLGSTDTLEALLYPAAPLHDPRQPDVKQAEAYSQVLLEKTEDWVIAHAPSAEET